MICVLETKQPTTAADSTEEVIQTMIEGARRMISLNKEEAVVEKQTEVRINPAMRRHFELQIKTLQNAPRDEGRLRLPLKLKERENEKATHIVDTQRLVTEIEMLKAVLFLVCRDKRKEEEEIPNGK